MVLPGVGFPRPNPGGDRWQVHPGFCDLASRRSRTGATDIPNLADRSDTEPTAHFTEPSSPEPAAVESEGDHTDHGAWRSERPKPISPLPTGGGRPKGRLGEMIQFPEPSPKPCEQRASQFTEPE